MLIQINFFLERIDFKSMHPTVCESYSSKYVSHVRNTNAPYQVAYF